MSLVVKQALFAFTPRACHLDDLLLDQNFRFAFFDIRNLDLRSRDRVHVIIIFQVVLQTTEAVVVFVAHNGFYHDLVA
jgi:hypothetical protein